MKSMMLSLLSLLYLETLFHKLFVILIALYDTILSRCALVSFELALANEAILIALQEWDDTYYAVTQHSQDAWWDDRRNRGTLIHSKDPELTSRFWNDDERRRRCGYNKKIRNGFRHPQNRQQKLILKVHLSTNCCVVQLQSVMPKHILRRYWESRCSRSAWCMSSNCSGEKSGCRNEWWAKT